MTRRRLWFGLTVLAYGTWVGWLALQTRDVKDPVVSRSQVAVADLLIRAELSAGSDPTEPSPKVTVLGEMYARDGVSAPETGSVMTLPDLSAARGFRGNGEYVLALTRTGEAYRLTVPPPSPGYDYPHQPWIYSWTESVERQVRRYVGR